MTNTSNSLKQSYKHQAESIIRLLARGNISGYYCESSADAVALAKELTPADSVVSFGGSMSLEESGVMQMLKSRDDIRLLDRSTATTPDEIQKMYRDALCSDVYFMSSNAITLNGELVNIDGNGNRVAALIYGPSKVVLVIGMNKLAATVDDAIRRVHNIAAPPNGVRLGKQTPCAVSGSCGDCFSPDCMCSHTVITRRCSTPDRIHVILVGETLGY